jgi:hypothetical protein
MSGQPTPPIITEPFAKNAAAPYIENPVPLTSATPGRASFDLGFPPITMTPVIAGGIPPFGQDVNGILYMVTAHIAALQAGQPYLYNATVAADIAGYAKGTILGMADGTGLWINQTNGNSTDPDAGGAGWQPMYRYGYTTLSGLTGGVRTVTPLEATSRVIVLAGLLVANLQVVLPGNLQDWLIVNTTSGAFATTVQTAAGTGVVVPQGGFGAPVEVYGDGTNIYPTMAPLTIPTAVAPTPNTYVLRDNLGNIYGTYLNQNSALENPTVGAVFVENAGADGFLRKIGLTDFEIQLLLQNMGGHVIDAQVPQSAVTQHKAAVLASAALTGAPTAPTPAAGDNSTAVATTAFVQGAGVQSGNGWVQLPNGLILQWGYAVGGGPAVPVTFPVPFPNAAFAAWCCTNRTGVGSNGANYVYALGLTGATFVFDSRSGVGSGWGGYFFAIGN